MAQPPFCKSSFSRAWGKEGSKGLPPAFAVGAMGGPRITSKVLELSSKSCANQVLPKEQA